MTKINDLHNKWRQDKAYDDLENEFALAAALIEARSRSGLTQSELNDQTHTAQADRLPPQNQL